MSVPSQCAAEGRCSRCARSIAIGFWRAMRGARSAARLMTTTIPIPMRARLSLRNLRRCLGSSIALQSCGWISQLGRCVRRLSFPSTVLPKVLRRYLANPFLEMLRETSNYCVDVTVPFTSLWRFDPLDHDSIASIRLAKSDHEHDGHIESQGEYRRAAR